MPKLLGRVYVTGISIALQNQCKLVFQQCFQVLRVGSLCFSFPIWIAYFITTKPRVKLCIGPISRYQHHIGEQLLQRNLYCSQYTALKLVSFFQTTLV